MDIDGQLGIYRKNHQGFFFFFFFKEDLGVIVVAVVLFLEAYCLRAPDGINSTLKAPLGKHNQTLAMSRQAK